LARENHWFFFCCQKITVALFWLLRLQTVGSCWFFSSKTVGYFSENQWFGSEKPNVNVNVKVNVNVNDNVKDK